MNKVKEILEENNIKYTVISQEKLLLKYGQENEIAFQIEILKEQSNKVLVISNKLYCGKIITVNKVTENLMEKNNEVSYKKELELNDNEFGQKLISALGEVCLAYTTWLKQNGKNI